MPVDIYGWVEISRWNHNELSDEHAWSGVINLCSLIDGTDLVSEALFGFSKRCFIGTDLGFAPLALNRGLPPNPSMQVREGIEAVRRHEQRFGAGELRAVTHINYEVVRSIDWSALGIADITVSDWAVVFQLVEQLRACGHLQNAAFRIVCWAVW